MMRVRIQLARREGFFPAGEPGLGTEPFFKVPMPDFGRRACPYCKPERAEHAEEVPVALELVIVVARARFEQFERLRVVRLALHLRRQRLIHFEAGAVIEARTFDKAARAYSGSPQRKTREVPPFQSCQFISYFSAGINEKAWHSCGGRFSGRAD